MSCTRSPCPSCTDGWGGSEILRSSTVHDILKGSRILITGAAGFVGAALLHRLLGDESFNVKQVVAIVRGKTEQDALRRLPKSIQHLAEMPAEGEKGVPRLVVVKGDCRRPNFGLNDEELEKVRETELVIHCAGDTRFTLPVSKAFESMADLAFFTARFSLLTWNVKTHIHISTTFVGWYLKDGSLVSETLTPQGCGTQVDEQGEHANTYLHAKTYAEAMVNSLFTSQLGRKLHTKACRIVRLSTLGPAIDFPRKGWGSGHPSSPVCAALASAVADPSLLAPNSGLDVVPVDIAVNQILSIAASAHGLHKLPASHPLSPKNPACHTNKHLAEVPCYHVACPESRIPMTLIISQDFKVEDPYVPAKNLLNVYGPFITKTVQFDVFRTRAVLGLDTLQPDQARTVSTEAPLADLPLKLNDETAFKINILKAVQAKWGKGEVEGWTGYLNMVRDEMESMGPRSDWERFVA